MKAFIGKHLPFIFSSISSLLCLSLFSIFVIVPAFQDRVPDRILLLFFVGIGCLFLPFLSRLKIGALIEIERVDGKVKQLIRGEVLRSPRGEIFYVDQEGRRYTVPDQQTADFLSSRRGQILMPDREIEEYPIRGNMDSVLRCKIIKIKDEGHLFAILNEKKYYISSWSPIFDWQREKEDFEVQDANAIRAIQTGR